MKFLRLDIPVKDGEVACKIKNVSPRILSKIAAETVCFFYEPFERQLTVVFTKEAYEAFCRKHELVSIDGIKKIPISKGT